MQAVSDRFKATAASNERAVKHKVTVGFPPTVETNLLPNGGFEHGLDGWVANSDAGTPTVTLTQDAAHAYQGTHSMRVDVAAGHGSASAQIGAIDVKPGVDYALGLRVLTEEPLVNDLWLSLAWFDARDGVTQVGSVSSPTAVLPAGTPAGTWELAAFSGMAPYRAGRLLVIPIFLSPDAATGGLTAAQSVWIDGGVITPDATVPAEPFTGDDPDCSWAGKVGQSTSIRSTPIYPDLTLALESAQVDRSVTTNVPASSKLIAGYPVATCTLTLSGLVDPADETKTIAWLADRYNTDSPLHMSDLTGSKVVVEAGFDYDDGPELVTVFTGSIDDYTVDLVAGTMTAQCIDGRAKIRSTPELPAVSDPMDVPVLSGGVASLATGLRPGLTSGWIFDTLLRANGIYSSPPARDGCVFYASLVGSAFPQVSSPLDSRATNSKQDTDQAMVFVDGRWNKGICRDVDIQAFLDGTVSLTDGGGYFFEFWLNFSYPPLGTFVPAVWLKSFDGFANLVWDLRLDFLPEGLGSWLVAANQPGSLEHELLGGAAIADGWHQVSGRVVFADPDSTFTVWIDGEVAATWTEAVDRSAATSANHVEFISGLPAEAVQVTTETDGEPAGEFTPTAFLDASLNNLAATLETSGSSSTPGTASDAAWSLFQDLAGVEFAVAGFDELEAFRFVNRKTIGRAVNVRALTTRESIKSIQEQSATANIANWVRQPITTVSRSEFTAVWSAKAIYAAPAFASNLAINVVLDKPATSIATATTSTLPDGGPSPDAIVSGYRTSRTRDGSGPPVHGIGVAIVQTSPTTATIFVSNSNPFAVFFVTPAGQGYADKAGTPCFQLGGETLDVGSSDSYVESQWPDVSVGGAAASPRGIRYLELPSSSWMQQQTPGQAAADDMLADLYQPKPMFTGVATVADPSLQLLDPVSLQDPGGNKMDEPALIVGIHLTLSKTDMSQALDLRALSPPGGWLLGVPGRSELGVNTYV